MMLETVALEDAARSEAAPSARWQNPKPTQLYRFVAIGDGAPAALAALEATQLGGRVALVARRLPSSDEVTRQSCDAGRLLARASRDPLATFESARDAILQRQSAHRPHEAAWRLSGHGIDVFQGDSAFIGPDTLEIEGQRLRFHRAALAVGSRLTLPAIDGLVDVGCITSETALSLAALPRRLAILGSGPAACELAQAFRRFGSDVHILDRGLALLPGEDPVVAQVIQRRFLHEGIHIHLGWTVQRMERMGSAKGLIVERHGQRKKLLADEVLLTPEIQLQPEGMGLEAAGVRYDAQGLMTDDRCCTTNPAIYALDAAALLPSEIVRNALAGGRHRRSWAIVPRTIDTDPQVAHVGPTLAEADAAGVALEMHRQELPDQGFALIRTRRGKLQVAAATVVGPCAAEVMAQICLAMAHGLPRSALRFPA